MLSNAAKNNVDINWLLTGNNTNDAVDYAPKKEPDEDEPIDFSEFRNDRRKFVRRNDDLLGNALKAISYIMQSGDGVMARLACDNLDSTAHAISEKHKKSPDHDGQGKKRKESKK